MNVAPNLPEPTYRFKNILAHIQNTKRLLRSLLRLVKKLFML